MAKVTFEMDSDEYIKLQSFIKEDSLENWQELKKIKDQCPVIYIDLNPFRLNSHKYYTKDFIIKEIDEKYNKTIHELDKEIIKLRDEIDFYKVISNGNFINRLKFIFTGKI
jgi:hypothetical protein